MVAKGSQYILCSYMGPSGQMLRRQEGLGCDQGGGEVTCTILKVLFSKGSCLLLIGFQHA